MPRPEPPQIDDSEIDENPFYVDDDGKPQVRDVGGFAPSQVEDGGLDESHNSENSPPDHVDKPST